MKGRAAQAVVLEHPVEEEPVSAVRHVPPFESIYEQYYDFVWCSVRRLGVGSATIDDIVQEIFVVIHSRIQSLRQPESLRSWIYGIVRRTVSYHHRSRKTRDAQSAVFAIVGELELPRPLTPSELIERSDELNLVFSLLEEMDAPRREIFVLAQLEQMGVPEIASTLRIPLNTAYSRLRSARILFEQKLARRALHPKREVKWRKCSGDSCDRV